MELREALVEREVEQLPEYAQLRYWNMIAKGESRQMALMLAMQKSPMMGESDRSFCETRKRCMGEMNAENRQKVLEIAAKAGINTHGKYYMSGLGRYDDPQSWVSSVDDAKAVCKRKNLTAVGLFNHKGTPMPPPKKVKLAPDIVNRYVQKELQNPKTAEKVRKKRHGLASLKEKVISEHTRSG